MPILRKEVQKMKQFVPLCGLPLTILAIVKFFLYSAHVLYYKKYINSWIEGQWVYTGSNKM